MRILSARVREISVDRIGRRVNATVILQLEHRSGEGREVRVSASAAITAPGGVPLKDRLIASAKLHLAMGGGAPVPEAEVLPTAA